MTTNGVETPRVSGAPGDPPVVHLWRYPGKPMLAAICGIDTKAGVRVTTMLVTVTCPDCRRVAMEANR